MSDAVLERGTDRAMDPIGRVRAITRRRGRRLAVTCTVLGAFLVVLAVLTLVLGDRVYGLGDIVRVVLGEQVPGASFTVGRLRIPQAVIGALAGAAFGISGIVFQTMLRNSLAAPDIVGISSGAGTGAVVAIILFGLSGAPVSLIALGSALAVAMLIYALAYRGTHSTTRLVLVGISIAAMSASLTSYILLRANNYDIQTALRWLNGSLGNASWDEVPSLAAAVVVLVPVMLVLSSRLRVLALGDDQAAALGTRPGRVRLVLMLAAVALIAAATAATGPIAFVAFLSGPIAVRLAGPHAPLVPAALIGACLVLGANLVGDRLLPVGYPVGVVTGAIGAPALLWLLARSTRSGGTA